MQSSSDSSARLLRQYVCSDMPNENLTINQFKPALQTAAGMALAGGVVFVALGKGEWALGWGLGAGWNLLNLLLLNRIGALLLSHRKNKHRSLLLLLLTKFGGLYPAGIWILFSGACSAAAFVAGFTVVLLSAAFGLVLPISWKQARA